MVALRPDSATAQKVEADGLKVMTVADAAKWADLMMMATPDDLDDFAVGFLFGEGIIRHNHEVHDIQIAPAEQGMVLDITIANRVNQIADR